MRTYVVNGQFTLTHNPVLPNEVATKGYVDAGFADINASTLTGEGTMPLALMPNMTTGDLSFTPGGGIVRKSVPGTAATGSKVTVNQRGLVTGISTLTPSDLTSLVPFSKFTTGKPTTVAGYGITDAFTTSDTVITGNLYITGTPTNPTDLVTKGYVDSLSGGGSATVETGDVIRYGSDTGLTGYLRCNGSDISKVIYAGLYAVIGDTFTSYIGKGSGQPWRQQYDINTAQSTDITGWTTGTSLPVTLIASQVIVTKNRVYLLGGYANSAQTSAVHTAPINTDGTLGAWTTTTPLPNTVAHSQAIVTKNRVYLIGGLIGSVESAGVYTAPINTDDTLGTWSAGTALPETVAYSQAIVTKNRVYLIGGVMSSVDSSTTYTAPINADGTLGTWTLAESLPQAVAYSQAIVTLNRVYLLGGYASGAYSSNVYTAVINSDGTLGTWSAGTSLSDSVALNQAIVTNNRVYLFGGYMVSQWFNKTLMADVNVDGTLGAWSDGTSLPGAIGASQTVVTKNHVYLLGGLSNSGDFSTVYTAPISGGLNDYSPYYDLASLTDTTTDFRLPDYSALENGVGAFYIKT